MQVFSLRPLQVTMFPLGGFRLIMKDFEGPDMEDKEVKEALRLEQQRWLLFWKRGRADGGRSVRRPPVPEGLIEEGRFEKKDTFEDGPHCTLSARRSTFDQSEIVETTNEVPEQRAHNRLHKLHTNTRRVSFQPDSPDSGASPIALHAGFHSGAPTVVARTEDGKETPPASPIVETVSDHAPSHAAPSLFAKFLSYLRTLPGPVSITLIVALIIAVIRPLKALFVPLTHEDGTPVIPFAPDGAPPLSFLLDTTAFLGNASVPLSLVCLGAALAGLKIPKRVRDLPWGAISALAFGRLILQPVVAVFMIQGLVRAGVVDAEDKVLRFVAM
jgi:predicted permease